MILSLTPLTQTFTAPLGALLPQAAPQPAPDTSGTLIVDAPGYASGIVVTTRTEDLTILAGDGLDVVFSGSGNDFITADGTYFGVAYSDVTPVQMLYGYGGDDVIKFVGNGTGWMYGGLGDDRLVGGRFDDRIYGGMGDDVIYGGDGNDHIESGDGFDWISAGRGDDRIIASGDGVYFGGLGDDRISSTFDSNARIHGNRGNDEINVSSHEMGQINHVYGGQGDDRIAFSTTYDAPDNVVAYLWGEGGHDRFSIHAPGVNVWGGTGQDSYFIQQDAALKGYTRIKDFDVTEDTLAIQFGFFNGVKFRANTWDEVLSSPHDLAKDTAYGCRIQMDERGAFLALIDVSLSDLSADNFLDFS